ncbi:Pao retrotransposon peptidase [Popillia japonica]|uniref:Pao retrotransposon peptidase n=1 Tax=Popillia japonica TaxID=7064 RepID=A0AAW1IWQ8_POPJA
MYRQVWIDEEQRKYQKILWRENPNDELKSYTLNTVTFGMAARFRTHKYVVTADVTQMYRQVWIDEEQRKYQKNLWRENPNDELKSYTLNTVTFGMAAAPFLAIRSLVEIAKINEDTYPNESQIIKRHFYVDDLLTGSSTIDDLATIKINIANILEQAGFKLRKWKDNYNTTSCNSVNALVKIPETSKVLGLYWNNKRDTFSFNVNIQRRQVTKRTILSTTAQLFDPLGLIAPVIVIAKLLMQEIWQLKLSWDEGIPIGLYNKWIIWIRELQALKDIEIPRLVLTTASREIQMHGFCDASEKAYGACVYLRSKCEQNKYTINLLASKSRVAPLKVVTLRRLELLGAVLLTQVMANLQQQCYPGSDGQVRVADIKCARGVFKRPVVKLCPLPMQGIEAKIVPSEQAVASEG